MLPKRFRLTKSEFNAVRKHGRLLSGKLMAILLLRKSQLSSAESANIRLQKKSEKSESDLSDLSIIRSSADLSRNSGFSANSQAGLIVSRRLSPKAVVRNLLKRRLRAALQRILPQISPDLHLVVLPNRRSLNATVEELESELRSLLTI